METNEGAVEKEIRNLPAEQPAEHPQNYFRIVPSIQADHVDAFCEPVAANAAPHLVLTGNGEPNLIERNGCAAAF